MKSPLPRQELRDILGTQGFLRLYEQDRYLYVSDAPRRVSPETLARILYSLGEKGFITEVSEARLLLIDVSPKRWEALLTAFPAVSVPFPADDRLHGVYELTRLLAAHPAPFEKQPMDMIRAVCKRIGSKNGLPALAPDVIAQCARRLRLGQPLPSWLHPILQTWLSQQTEEAYV